MMAEGDDPNSTSAVYGGWCFMSFTTLGDRIIYDMSGDGTIYTRRKG